MADFNINVNPDKMILFSNYVRKFGKDTMSDCKSLNESFQELKKSTSDAEIYKISKVINNISEIIESAQPDINKLSERIDDYAAFVKKLKELANS